MFDFFSPIEQIRRITSQKAVKNIDESYGYLQNDFSSVARILSQYNPLELMKLSLWDERKVKGEKVKDAVKRASSSLLPVLLQSVLSSTYFTSGGVERNVSTRDWTRLKSLAEDVVRRLVRLIENRTALSAAEEGFSDSDAVNYRNIIASYLLTEDVTAFSLSKDSSLLRSLLEEKVELEEKTGVDYLSLSLNIDNIAKKGLMGIDDLCARVQAYRSDYELAAAKMKSETEGKSEEEAYRIITAANGWEGRAENLTAERDGFDSFRLSSLSSLDGSVWKVFTVSPGSLDLVSFMKMGYWPSLRFPFVTWKGEAYTFVGKHIPHFIALTSSFSRRRAALHDVLAIFYRIGVDTYTYDGNSIDISVLESFYDRNLFTDAKAYEVIRKLRDDEWALKPGYGHRRLIVDPDEREDMREERGALVISSAFMAEAAIDRTKKRDLLRALLGTLDLPEEKSEYNIVDEDELDRSDSVIDDVADDTVTDEFEYDPTDEDEEAKRLDERDESVELVEYERKNSVDISDVEKKYALTDEIIRKDEEIEKEEEAYESELDDDIFDDTEEEERLDEIGEKEVSEYYEDIEEEPPKEEVSTGDVTEADDEDEGQLDFFSLLDEDEEKAFDDELEKEDEDEFRADEEKAEELEVGEPTLEDEIADKIEEEISDENSETPDTGDGSAYALFPEDEDKPEDGEESGSSDSFENDISEASGYSEEFETETEEEDEEEDFSPSVSEYDGTSLIDDDTEVGDSLDEADAEIALSDEEEEIETSDDDYSPDEEDSASDERDEEEDVSVEVPASDEEEIGISDEDGVDETPEEEKPLDVSAWMNDFLGLNDIKADDDEDSGDREDPEADEEIDVEDEDETERESDEVNDADESDDEEESGVEEESEVEDTNVEDEPEAEEPGAEDDSVTEEEVDVEDETEDFDTATDSDSEEEIDVEDETEDFEAATDSDIEAESVEDNDVEDDSETEEVKAEDNLGTEEDAEAVTGDSGIEESAVEENNVDDESCDDGEASAGEDSDPEEKTEEEEKPLDVNSWMSDFLGLNDVAEKEDETSSDEANLNDDGFVLPRMGMIEEEEKEVVEEKAEPVKEEEAEEKLEENAFSVTLDDEAVPTPVDDIKLVNPDVFSTTTDRGSVSVGVEEGEIPESQSQGTPEEEEVQEKQVLSMEELDGADDPIPLMTAVETPEDDVIQFSGIVSDIYKKLLGSGGVFRSFVKGADSETLEELENIIQSCWNRMQSEQKDKLFNVPDFSFSILLSHDSKRDDLRMAELLNNVGGVMYSRGKEEWTAVILYINSSYNLETAMEKTLTKESFSPSDWKRVTYIGEQMRKR